MCVPSPLRACDGSLQNRTSGPRYAAKWATSSLPSVYGKGIAMADLLEFKNVTKVYSRGLLSKTSTTALNNVSLKLDQNEPTIMTVAGESGSGKTTLAMLLLGFITAT